MASSPTIVNQRSSSAGARPVKKIAVAGVSGYAGGELARLLLHHPRLDHVPLFLGRENATETHLSDLHPQLARPDTTVDTVHPFSWDLLRTFETEILLLATPHQQSREWVPIALQQGIRVIDLSGAWRLQVPTNYAVYKLTDTDVHLASRIQAEAVYGSPELHRDQITTATLVANPGCYATSIILALAPLLQGDFVDMDRGIVCDAKSGVSGAGKAATARTHFMYAADNFSAYSPFGHRHTGELLEQLHLTSDAIRFTPHLLPIPRGILSSIYLRLKRSSDAEAITAVFREFFAASPLVRVHTPGDLPQIQNVVRTNFCDIGVDLSPNGRDLLVVSCLDNLLKGAAGQAVQNLNLMCGWGEAEGLL